MELTLKKCSAPKTVNIIQAMSSRQGSTDRKIHQVDLEQTQRSATPTGLGSTQHNRIYQPVFEKTQISPTSQPTFDNTQNSLTSQTSSDSSQNSFAFEPTFDNTQNSLTFEPSFDKTQKSLTSQPSFDKSQKSLTSQPSFDKTQDALTCPPSLAKHRPQYILTSEPALSKTNHSLVAQPNFDIIDYSSSSTDQPSFNGSQKAETFLEGTQKSSSVFSNKYPTTKRKKGLADLTKTILTRGQLRKKLNLTQKDGNNPNNETTESNVSRPLLSLSDFVVVHKADSNSKPFPGDSGRTLTKDNDLSSTNTLYGFDPLPPTNQSSSSSLKIQDPEDQLYAEANRTPCQISIGTKGAALGEVADINHVTVGNVEQATAVVHFKESTTVPKVEEAKP